MKSSTRGSWCPNCSYIRNTQSQGRKRVRRPVCSPGESKQTLYKESRNLSGQTDPEKGPVWIGNAPLWGNRSTSQGRRSSRKHCQKGRSLEALGPEKSQKPFRRKTNIVNVLAARLLFLLMAKSSRLETETKISKT
jgi:hypothetical protein